MKYLSVELSKSHRELFDNLPEEEQDAITACLNEKGEIINALYDEEVRKHLVLQYQNNVYTLEDLIRRDFKPVIANKLLAEFNKILKDPKYFYDDNHRYAEVGNHVQEQQYEKQRSKGCCGFYDTTVVIKG